MIPDPVLFLVELAVLTAGYRLADLAVREDGLLRALGVIGLGPGRVLVPLLGGAGLLALGWSWAAVPEGGLLRALAVVLTALLAWKAATRDIDVVTKEVGVAPRLALAASAALVVVSPAFLLVSAVLLTRPFGTWQHHATMPMRVLLALVAFSALAPLLGPTPLGGSAAVLVFFLLLILVSHYLITALAKGYLGPRWTSWVTDNRLHHLAASAYSWGWARFIPWPAWRRVIGVLRVLEKPMQLFAFSVELLAPLALLDARLGVALCLLWAAFHVGVFLASGLLFWEWVLTDLAVAGTLVLLPASVAERAFGPVPLVVGLAFLVLFPLRHKLWRPMPLGWWDTPFTQRMHWLVEGESGTVYEVYNDFMCPHERIYGKVHGCFLAPTRVCTYHLGEVWKHDLRDALRAAGPSLERLEDVRDRFGIEPRSDELAERHRAYLRSFFRAINAGATKHVLPRGLRWLKAPGGQLYHWGELPAYRGQEPAARVRVVYREEYFDGERLVRLRDEVVEEIEVGQGPVAAAREPTPKELDDFLLGFARGRLIDLPSFGEGYVRGDDGKA
ncbi:MAG: hypothetical protein ACFCGT_15780 [Sandaracinaceae bacterium]